MAGGGTVAVGSSRRKSLDAEINLVPFIDLLSMCICFLLMTAVWIQIGVVQVKQSRGTEAAASKSKDIDIDVKFANSGSVELAFKRGGRMLKKLVSKPDAVGADLDRALQALGKPAIAAAMITPRGGVSYGELVSVMDVLRKRQIVNLGVVPVTAN